MGEIAARNGTEPNNESATRLAERAARLLIDLSPVVHYLARISEPYGATFISPGVRAQLGYEPRQFTEDPDFWAERVHPDDRPQIMAQLARIGETGRERQNYRFRHSDGRWRWMHDEAVLVRDEDGAPLEIAGAWLDVTELKQSEASLARQKAFSESLIETAQAIVLLLDPKGRIVEINPYMEQLSGYSAEEVVGKDWFSTFLPEKDRPDIHSLFGAVMEAGINTGHTNPIVLKNGTLRQIEWLAKILEDGSGRPIGLLNIGHDVTERIEYEQALKGARRQAEKANASKSRFLAAANHDLRQPLYALRLFLGVLAGQLDAPHQASICEKMQHAIDGMAELLDALLDISRLESGSISPQKESFSLQALLDRIVVANQQQAEHKGLRLESATDDCTVVSDPALLERILSNLVANAIRYTNRGGVHIGYRCSNETVRIEVSDTGIGIPGEALEKIFEEYYQLDNPGRDRRKGLGLGLAIVKQIARLLDHRLDVESVPGKGSVFSVEVAKGTHEVARKEPIEHEAALRVRRGASALLVEDDPTVLEATAMLLELAGAQVIGATCADDALARLKEGLRPDVVITDYRLPDQSGIEGIGRIRECAGADTPVILVTGDTSLTDAELANLSNCSVLHKPVDVGKLTELVARLTS